MAAWAEKPPVSVAVAEFESTLEANPFDGQVSLGGLAKVVKAISASRAAKKNPLEVSQLLADLSEKGADAADTAGQAEYVEMFEAQGRGHQAVIDVAEQAKQPKAAPTPTATQQMSGAKS